tara:strand:- start:247 stop:540 length:294 start_codon:yes stop_codon:yes gene_type:complete
MNYLDRADEVYEERRDEAWQNIEVIQLDKYKANLTVCREQVGSDFIINVFSYETLVASGCDGALLQRQWYSTTTQKHVNYVARELGMKVIKLWKSTT